MGRKPNLEHLRIFGSKAFVNVPKQHLTKLDARAKKMILVGYESNSSNYRVYDPVTKKVTVSRDVVFHERIGKITLPANDDSQEEIILPKVEEVIPVREEEELEEEDDEVFLPAENEGANQREVASPVPRGGDTRPNLRDRGLIRRPSRYETNVVEYEIPATFEEAMESKDSVNWIDAIDKELQAHQDNRTWSLVERKPGMKTIDSKWVFRKLKNTEGEVCRFKARLCARGFMQKKGVDFSETFAPVVRYDSLRMLLAIIASRDLELTQFDVQTAFLYGKLDEEIFMEVPDGLCVGESVAKDPVCRLEKSLYGLKQAPRCWNREFSAFLKEFRFKETDADKCIFVGHVGQSTVYLALYVDDGLIAAESREILEFVLEHLRKAFKITIGDASLFVGMQIERDRVRKLTFVHQSAYARRVLEKFGMIDAKSMSVPSDPNVILNPVLEKDKVAVKVPYREAVGSLMFLAIVSRPDIAFAVNSVSKFLNNPSYDHWRAVKRILAYVSRTLEYGIEFRGGGSVLELIGYSDADYAGDVETRRSTTGYIFELAGGPVTWASQRQKLVTLSTTESEYVAASVTSREAIWLRKLLSDIECPCADATTIYVDNQSAIRLVKNPEFHKRTKHIDIRYHYIREKVDADELHVEYLCAEEQKADIFTKALSKERFCMLRESIGVVEFGPRINGGSVKNV